MKCDSILAFVVSLAFCLQIEAASPAKKWVVYFHENLPNEVYAPYSLIILEGDQYPDISPLLESKKTVLGYLGVGEVSYDRYYFTAVKKEGLLLETNKNWPDSRMVDLRNKLWTKRIIEELIPCLLFQHFSGIFLDTVDNAIYLEEKDPIKYRGMKQAAIELIKTIRLHYPHIVLMMNRGLAILPHVAKDIDMVLAENILAEYDFKTHTSHLVPEKQYLEEVKKLKEAKEINPRLEIYTLDYWDTKDKEGMKKIYDIQMKQGFYPYVTSIELDQITPSP